MARSEGQHVFLINNPWFLKMFQNDRIPPN